MSGLDSLSIYIYLCDRMCWTRNRSTHVTYEKLVQNFYHLVSTTLNMQV
jgi:hypothetical protein